MQKTIPAGIARIPLWHLLIIAVALAYPAGAWAGVGGGYTAAGLHGDYFANTNWTGAPAFSRQDDRVDFPDIAPANHLSPAGSFSTGFKSVGATNWSARWTGQIIPRFSETYTFNVLARGSCQLKINGKAIIDQPKFNSAPVTATCPMIAGTKYDIEIDYSHAAGDWAMSVHWSSPSTPEETIDPLGFAGVHVFYYEDQSFANLILGANDCTGPKGIKVEKDALGWPTADARFQLMEDGGNNLGNGTHRNSGTYLLQFTGRAEVTSFNGAFTVDGKNYHADLPSGIGWDANTNITTANVVYAKGISHLEWLTFLHTRRTPADTKDTGVTNVKLMASTELGGTTPYDPDIFFQPIYKQNLSRYTALRRPHNEYYEPDYTKYKWSDRNPGQAPGQGTHTAYEWLILLSNETGKDCFLQLPVEVGNDYVKKVALMYRFGSDGLNPYDPAHEKDSLGNDLYNPTPESGPKYPPLNSNLRLYIESGNEVWAAYGADTAGYGGAENYCRKASLNIVPGEDHAADYAILNYDGHTNMRRYTLLRTKQISDIFRTVFPTEMPDGSARIRPIWEWQYKWTATFQDMLAFFDHYFNNGDGIKHVVAPHPISHYIWGGGGAVYFSPGNPDGTQKDILFANPSFDQNAIPAGTTSTTIAGWTTTGNAGIYHTSDHVAAAASQTLGTIRSAANTTEEGFGYKFTVGKADLVVFELGRWVAEGDSQEHMLSVVQADTGKLLTYARLVTKGAKPGQFAYAKLNAPMALKANTSYFIVSSELTTRGKPDPFYDQDTTISVKEGITIDGAISAVRNKGWWTWTSTPGTPGNHAYGPVDFKFVRGPIGDLGYPPDPIDGNQAAYLGDTGTLSQSVNFTKPGNYAIKFRAAGKPDFCNRIRLEITDPSGHATNITPLGQSDWRVADLPYAINTGWAHDYRSYGWNSSAVFNIPEPGAYTIKITGAEAKKYIYFDNMEIASLEAMFTGGLGGGSAMGQPKVDSYAELLRAEANWCVAYGLKEVAYEGGWSAGGDFGQLPYQTWAKFCDPQAKQAQIDSLDLFKQAGSTLYICGSYEHWPENYDSFYADASKYMLPQAVDVINDRLPATPTNGTALPAKLTPKNSTVLEFATSRGDIRGTGGWIDWNVITPTTSSYTLTAKTTDGSAILLIDDTTAVPSGSSIKLTAGLHTVKLKSTVGAVTVDTINITRDNP